MNKKKKIIIVGIVCLLALLLAVAVALLLDPPEKPIKDEKPTNHQGEQTTPDQEDSFTKEEEQETAKPNKEEPEKPDKETSNKADEEDSDKPDQEKPNKADPDQSDETDSKEEETTPPDDLPPFVEIPDEDQEKEGLQFPCEVPGYHLMIEKLAPYSGIFVEDGSNADVTDVAMLLVYNAGQTPVEYAQITVQYPQQTLEFYISALPAGERLVVQEKTGKSVPEGVPQEASALVVQRAQMEIAPEISVTDNADNTLTIRNLTDKTIPTVRVFYKYYMEEEDLFVGGIAFTVRLTRLSGQNSVVIQPSHYVSKTSRVVMALIYDTEV